MENYEHPSPIRPEQESDLRKILRQRKKVPVNTAILLINVLLFILVELTGTSMDAGNIVKWGGAYTPLILQGEVYRLLTSMFLHFGIQHLGNNMLVLFFVGDCLERNIGKIRYLLIYLLGGLGANLISFWLEVQKQEAVVSAGASGAVFAVIGALLIVVIRNRGRLENFTTYQLVMLAALSLYHGIVSTGVDNAAHFGGLVCGAVLGLLLYRRRRRFS